MEPGPCSRWNKSSAKLSQLCPLPLQAFPEQGVEMNLSQCAGRTSSADVLIMSRCGNRRRKRWKKCQLTTAFLLTRWFRDALNAFLFFPTMEPKKTPNNNKTPPTPANRDGSSHYCSSSSIAAQVFWSTQFCWPMRNDGMCYSGSVRHWILSTQAKVIWALKKRRCPWKAQAGPAALVGVSRETRSARQALCRRILLLLLLQNLIEMCLCYRKGKLIIFLSSWHISRKKLFCVSTVSGVSMP